MRYVANITEPERIALEEAHKNHKTNRVRNHAHVILLSNKRYQIIEISDICGINRQAVSRVISGLEEEVFSKECKLRQVKYLNNNVKLDHRFMKRLVRPRLGFGSFNTARQTLKGGEAMNMIRKGQIKGVKKGEKDNTLS